jgi:hypothetical protein
MSADKRWVLHAVVLVLVCYVCGVYELLCALGTSVTCTPTTVTAGSAVSCVVTTLSLAQERDLSLTPLGDARSISMVGSAPHTYQLQFGTGVAGVVGVRLQHSWLYRTAAVDVLPAAARGAQTEVACAPARVKPGEQVRCSVVPRDEFGNAGEVVRPAGSAAGFFSVSRTGSAGEVTVHDTFVEFVAGEAGSAGISVTLDGVVKAHAVEVSAA